MGSRTKPTKPKLISFLVWIILNFLFFISYGQMESFNVRKERALQQNTFLAKEMQLLLENNFEHDSWRIKRINQYMEENFEELRQLEEEEQNQN